MDATIEGEDGQHLKIHVEDNEGVRHDLTLLTKSGEIVYHDDQQAYPDTAAEQTPSDAVNLRQAQWYAKYHVQRERGYPTLGSQLTPEWLPYTLGAVFGLSFDAFEDHVGHYAQQYHSALRPDVDPIVEMPDETAQTGLTVYRADVFLGLDFEAYLDDPETASPVDAVTGITDAFDLYETLSEELSDRLVDDTPAIKEVSALDLQYQRRASDGRVEEPVVGERSYTSEGPPDAQLQMTPPQTSIESTLTTEIIQGLVCHHLQCQVRDAYLRLGLEPPEPFRVLGQGLAEQTMHYQHADCYPEYHLTDADIEGYRQPGVKTGALRVGEIEPGSELPSLSTRLKRALFGG